METAKKEARLQARRGILEDIKKSAQVEAGLAGSEDIRKLTKTEEGRAKVRAAFRAEADIVELDRERQLAVKINTIQETFRVRRFWSSSQMWADINNVNAANMEFGFNVQKNHLESLVNVRAEHARFINSMEIQFEQKRNRGQLAALDNILDQRVKKEVAAKEAGAVQLLAIEQRTANLGKEIRETSAKESWNKALEEVNKFEEKMRSKAGTTEIERAKMMEAALKVFATLREEGNLTTDELSAATSRFGNHLMLQFEQNHEMIGTMLKGMSTGFSKAFNDINSVSMKFFKGQIKAEKALGVVGIRVSSEIAAAALEGIAKRAKGAAVEAGARALYAMGIGMMPPMFGGSPTGFAAAAKFGAAAAAYGALSGVATSLAGQVRAAGEKAAEKLLEVPGEEELDAEAGGRQGRRFGQSIQAQNLNITIAPHTTITGENVFLSDGSISELESNISQIAVEAIQSAIENQEIDLAPAVQAAAAM